MKSRRSRLWSRRKFTCYVVLLAMLFSMAGIPNPALVYAASGTESSQTVAAAVYTVTVDNSISGGTIAVEPASGPAGEIITVTVTPDEGKQLVAGSLQHTADGGENHTEITATKGVYSFLMPEADVTVTAQFKDIPAVTYSVTVDSAITGGTVEVGPTGGAAGDTITVTVTPASGQQLVADSLKYTADGESYTEITATDGVYSFVLPAANVTVTAQFEDEQSGPAVWDGTSDVAWYTEAAPGTTIFHIATAEELAGFASLVNNGNNFAGKTIRLTADILLNNHLSSGADESARPWIPISDGGTANGVAVSFQGVFDGQGHLVQNLYYHDPGATSVPVGLFGGIDNGAVICNVGVTGYIRAYRYIAGIAGLMGSYGSGDAPVIENCVNYATIIGDASGTRGVGGIAGNARGLIRNCYNAGDVTDLYLPAGGIAGILADGTIENCYNTGTVVSVQGGASYQGAIVATRSNSGSTVKDCYWLDTSCTGAAPYGSGTVTNVEVKTAEQMKAADFPALLNPRGSIFLADTDNINNGYPILYWQSSAVAGIPVGVTVGTPENGSVSYQAASPLAYGAKINLHNEPAPGYVLDYYTVNGERISGDYYYLTGEMTVSAVFVALTYNTITVPDGGDVYSITVTKKGTALVDGVLVNVTDYPVNSGDRVYQNDVLTVAVTVDTNVIVDADREYSGAYTVAASGAVTATANRVFTVTGDGEVELTVTPVIQNKRWATLADMTWYTEAAPGTTAFTISSAAQLAGLAKLVSTGETTFEGLTVTLGGDIDLANTDGSGGIRYWTAIGTSTSSFRGIFDGADHTISNLRTEPGVSQQALFHIIQAATVKNVVIDGAISGGSSLASIAYQAAAGSVVENCVNNADITATSNYVGGIVAYLNASSVTGCVNNGAVTGSYQVGGIVGFISAFSGANFIDSCVNNGAVTAAYKVGGIAGEGPATVTRCLNSAPVTATSAYSYGASYSAGGIIGYLGGSVAVELCANSGAVSGSAMSLGGIAGYMTGASSIVRDCYNTGSVTGTSSSDNAAAGGVVGYTDNNNCTVQNTYNAGSISASNSGEYTAGVIGYARANTNVSNNYYLDTTATRGLGYAEDNAVSKTSAELQALAPLLGEHFKPGSLYPVLSWQETATPVTYTVTVDSAIEGGSVTVDPASAAAGETVTVTVTPDSGKRLVAGSLQYTADGGENHTEITATEGVYSFVMPEADVTVTAQFENFTSVAYSITKNPVPDGIWTVTLDKTEASAGETVTVTVSDTAFTSWATGLVVTGQSGTTYDFTTITEATGNANNVNGAGVYSFVMPVEPVTVDFTADYTRLDVYIQYGAAGEEIPVHSYTRAEMEDLAAGNTEPIHYAMYDRLPAVFMGKAVRYVTIEQLTESAAAYNSDVRFDGPDCSLRGASLDGWTLGVNGLSWDYLMGQPRKYYAAIGDPYLAPENRTGEDRDVPAVLAITGWAGREAQVDNQPYDTLNTYRFFYGQNEAEYGNGVLPTTEEREARCTANNSSKYVNKVVFVVPETDPATYTVTADSGITGGSLVLSPTSGSAGDTITVTVNPDAGRQLMAGSLQYTTDNGDTYTEITATEGVYSFTLPAADTVVTARFVNPDQPLTGVSLDKSTLALTVGSFAQLTATVTPADAGNQEVTWTSDNTAAATVGGDGLVRAMGSGTATITVTTVDGGLTAACAVTVQPAGEDHFTIAVLPDTQFYSESYPEIFAQQTQWIAENAESQNIVFVAHVGDIQDDFNDPAQWQNARDAMAAIRGAGIPYSLVPGNHDLNFAAGDTSYFDTYFPYTDFTGYSWYGGHYPEDSNASSYQLFSAMGQDFIVLNLVCTPALLADATDWANAVLSQYSDRKAIVVTHGYIKANGEYAGGEDVSGPAIRDNIVKKHSNVVAVFCGHINGQYHGTDTGSGNTIYNLLTNYTDLPNGGNGWLRLYQFYPLSNTLQAVTYSPYLDQFDTSTYGQFQLPLEERFVVTVDSAISGGTVTVNPASGVAGSTISITVSPDAGQQLKEGSLKYTADGGTTYTEITAADGVYSFILPAANVTVTAQFEDQPEYKTPPDLTPDTTNNNVGQAVDITFSDDEAWRNAISSIAVDGTELTSEQYTVSAGNICIVDSVFTVAGAYTISIEAAGYIDATVTQMLNGGIDFTYTITSGAATISGYTGSGGAVVVPSAIVHNGTAHPVVSIGRNAFSENTSLTSVTLPEGLTSIGMNAFSGCTGLISVTLPASLTTIGNHAFFFCTELTSVTLPASLTSMGNSTFQGCAALTSVTVPEGLTSIGSSAFSGCTGLTSLTLPVSLTSIGMNAFYNCRGLTSIALPEGLTNLNPYAFSGCRGLTSLTLPASLTTIASAVFDNCTGLTSVTLSEGLTTLGIDTFRNCTGLTSLTLPASLTSIDFSVFQGCSNLTDITAAAESTVFFSIEGVLFNKALDTLIMYPVGKSGSYTVPDGVTGIGANAFYGCVGLTSVTLPAGLTSIGNQAFRGCQELSAAYFLGNRPTSLGTEIFRATHADLVVYYHVSKAASWSAYTTYPAQPFCVLTLDLQDGSEPVKSYAAVTDGYLTAPADPIRENYTFGGWYKEAACANAFDFGSETVTGDMTLYARWTAVPGDNPKYTVTPAADDSVYEVGTTPDGISTMTVKTGVSGLKYFGTLITPVVEHEGQEAVVFTHLRDGVQFSLNVTKADFDLVDQAQAGFNVQAGDVVKVFIMDDLTNDTGFNPILLQ